MNILRSNFNASDYFNASGSDYFDISDSDYFDTSGSEVFIAMDDMANGNYSGMT